MKISKAWLHKYINIKDYSNESLSDIMTSLGLEVEGIEEFESVKGGFKGLVVGQVLECEKHENADKLKITKVDVGMPVALQIVCGASNVAVGQKVVVALENTTLYPKNGEHFEIRKSKIRGVESQGMICSSDEIGLEGDHSGILVLDPNTKIGTKVADLYNIITDTIFEIGLTPNRSDATCHLGVAKDIKAYVQVHNNYQDGIYEPGLQSFYVNNTGSDIKVDVLHPDCIRYSGLVLTNIKIASSPEWLKNLLNSIGVKSINNVVDITNYILHEYGQPLHAFDYEKIANKHIVVTKLEQGSEFLALDERKFKLKSEDLMICDGNNKGMCIAGVFGGKNSGVTDQTTSIFLESAHFSASCVRKTSMSHNLRTDAAKVFEKGSDPNITVTALKRAAIMLSEYAGATVSSEIIDIYPHEIENKEVVISTDKVRKLIGVNLSEEKITDILTAMEMGVKKLDHERLIVSIPTNKVDVTRDVDLIEEILRIYGFNNVPIPPKVYTTVSYSNVPDRQVVKNKISDSLVANGYLEMMGLSLIESKFCTEALGLDPSQLVSINNTSNIYLDAMRPDMMISGLRAITHNYNRQNTDLKIFEIGKTYQKNNFGFSEVSMLSIFLSGNKTPEHWLSKLAKIDFYDIKHIIIKTLHTIGISKFQILEITEDRRFTYGCQIKINNNIIGSFGLISQKVARAMDVKSEVFYGEIILDEIFNLASTSISTKSISKFPAVTRDLAFVFDKSVNYFDMETAGKKVGKPLLTEMTMFDIYENENQLGKNKKSVALRFVFEDATKTLVDKEIDQKVEELIKTYTTDLKAILRS